MYHKFKDYNKNEQREIVFEIIRQKYMYDQSLNDFGKNCKILTTFVRGFCQNNQITSDQLKTQLDDFYKSINKDDAEEVLFYFYNIVEGLIEKADPSTANRYSIFNKMIENLINVDAIRNTIETPEDKISNVDRGSGGGFSMVGMNKYPAPSSYVEPPPPPYIHNNLKNPYYEEGNHLDVSNMSICDYMRFKIFDTIKDEKIEDLMGLEDIDASYLVPGPDEFINFPQVKLEESDDEYEDLDFENSGDFVINNENSITFGGGGDWQDPKTFTMKMVNGKVKAFDIHDDYDECGYGAEEIIRIICELFGLKKKNYDPDSEDPNDFVKLYNDMVKNKDFKLPSPVNVDLKTEDCVEAIIDFFPDESSDFHNPKNWKRKSKTGSGTFTRIFENKVTKDVVKVTSTKTDIISIELVSAGVKTFSQSVADPIEEDFPFKEVYQYATIYSKEKKSNGLPFADDFSDFEPEDYNKYKMKKGTVIALAEPDADDDDGAEITEIVKFTQDSYYYSYEDKERIKEVGLTTDMQVIFQVSKDKIYDPASEPIDLIWTDYSDVTNRKELEKLVKKYNLSHILLTM